MQAGPVSTVKVKFSSLHLNLRRSAVPRAAGPARRPMHFRSREDGDLRLFEQVAPGVISFSLNITLLLFYTFQHSHLEAS